MLDNFADELKKTRISQNLSLQQVAVKTRIDYKFLEAMERGDFEFLPEIYVKSFLKEYLRTLGLDEKLYLKKYQAAKTGVDMAEPVPETPQETDPVGEAKDKPVLSPPPIVSQFDAIRNYRQKEEQSSSFRKKKQLTYYITAGVIAGVGILYLLFFRGSDEIIVPEKPWEEIVEDTREKYNDDLGTGALKDSTAISSTGDSLSLTIRATDTTWIKIVLDNSRTEEFILFPGSQKSMKAGNDYKIIIGNSGGVKLDLNGKPVTYKVQSGSVQRIQIDSSGVRTLEYEAAG